MASDLGLVAHPAKGHAHKLAIGRAGQGFAQRRLAHTRRADQTEHRALELAHTLLYGQVFKDTLLDLFQTVVIGLQHLFSPLQVMLDLAGLFPWHLGQPVDVGAHYRRLG